MTSSPHCVYCDSTPTPIQIYDDLYWCLDCGELSFRQGETWRPMYEATIHQEFTEEVAKYFFKRLKFIVNQYRNT